MCWGLIQRQECVKLPGGTHEEIERFSGKPDGVATGGKPIGT
jgi:hypothetical protein